MLVSGIYKIKNLQNGKFYIGRAAHIKDRWYLHKRHFAKNIHCNKLLKRAWEKYGKDNFVLEVLEYCEKDKLIEREQYWLDLLKPYDLNIGYNLHTNSIGPVDYKHTEETKRKISLGTKGKKLSPEACKNISNYQLNRSEEHKRNMSIALKKRVFSPEHRRKLSEANQRTKLRKQQQKLQINNEPDSFRIVPVDIWAGA